MDPALQELFAEGGAGDEVAVIVRIADGAPLPEGIRLVARFGPIWTCRLRRGDIPRVRAAHAVHSMKAAHLYGPMPLDDEPDDTEATDFSFDARHTADAGGGGPGPDAMPGDQRRPDGALPTGEGTVVAHIDFGLDFTHPEFRNPDGSTRLLALWDQSQPMEPDQPNPYGYGRIYSSEEIDRALASPQPWAALGYHAADSDPGPGSHGTHTMAISGGNGRSGGPCGMAPGAQLVFVHLSTYTAEGPTRLGDSVALLEAIDFISGTAGDRPFVINASIGRHAGQHDGRTLTEQGMDAFLLERPGRAIVLSTGNYFKRASHAQGLVRPGDSCSVRLIADSERRTPTEIDLWYPGSDRMSITISGPNGQGEIKAAPGERVSIVVKGREVGRLYHRVNDPNNGDCQVTLLLYAAAPPAHWEITLHGDDVTDGRYHAWVERDPICARCQAHFVEADSEPTGTTGTICNGLRTIAVGAYNAHRQERPLARFSSCGPTRDGRQKPDLIAPGVRVLAARSCPRGGRPGTALLTRMSGTSMAAPHVAGTIALMFEAAGRPMSIDETRRLLLGVAEEIASDADSLTRLRTGSGILDTAAAVAAAGELSTTPPISRENIMSDDNAEASGEAGDSAGHTGKPSRKQGREYRPYRLPFQVQWPIGGGAPAISMPLGAAGSPFAFTVPLGGQPAAPQAASAPAPGCAAPPEAPQPGAAPAASWPDPSDPVAALRTDAQFYAPPEGAQAWAEWAPPGARSMIRRGSRGPGVQEAQRKLNEVHRRRQMTGAPGLAAAPLAEDGTFGGQTHQATVSFQQLAFPGQPNEWDGVIGPKTWAMLDQMSSAPVPVPQAPPQPRPANPPMIPVSSEGCGNLLIWISAFIPRDVPGYTIPVPAGPHAGKTAVPCPMVALPANPNCLQLAYLTDQRTFNSSPTESSRMRSLAEIQLVPPRLVRDEHKTTGTIEINKFTGAVTCIDDAVMDNCSFDEFRAVPIMMPAGSFKITMRYRGAASDPCVNLAANIDYNGQIEILCVPASNFLEVRVSGFVDSFPAFEMYASLGGTTRTLFTLAPPAGNTVVDLLGGAGTPVTGRAQFHCTFGQPDQPMPGTAFTASEEADAAMAAQEALAAIAAESAWQTEDSWAGESAAYQSGSGAGSEALAHASGASAAECGCADQRVARADSFAQAPASAPKNASALIEALLDSGNSGDSGESGQAGMDEGDTATLARPPAMSPTVLFNLLARPGIASAAPQLRQLAERFDIVARPGDQLQGIVPHAGDLMIRVARGEGWGNVGVVASNGAQPLARLSALGLHAEGGPCPKPGSYLHVVEIGPRPAPASAGLARRLADAGNLVLGDTLLLRPLTAEGGAEAEAVCCGDGAAAAGEQSAEMSEFFWGPLCDTLSRFGRDSDTLLAAHRTQIQAASRNILSRGITSVAVTGFASSEGANDYNHALGMRRAQQVAGALRTALDSLRAGSSSAVAIAVTSRGEEAQIAGGTATLNRRVTICPAAPPRPQVQPPPVRQKVFRITAKSFIGRIGSRVGSLSCGLNTRFGHIPSPTTNPALRAFAALTDTAFSENPLSDGIFVAPPPDNKGYRLFSSSRIQVEHRGTQLISAAVLGSLLTDAGKECVPRVGLCLHAPPLIVDMAPTFTRIDASRMRVTWGVRGRPPAAAEPAFDAICSRSSVYIWHRVKAVIDCSSGVPVFSSLVVEGSRFPSHRLWLDGVQMHNVPQGPFSGLWDEVPGDPSRVR